MRRQKSSRRTAIHLPSYPTPLSLSATPPRSRTRNASSGHRWMKGAASVGPPCVQPLHGFPQLPRSRSMSHGGLTSRSTSKSCALPHGIHRTRTLTSRRPDQVEPTSG